MFRLLLALLVISASYLAFAVDDEPAKPDSKDPAWDDTSVADWNAYELVEIPSSVDGHPQKAYFQSADKEAPLLVELHTWSGNYQQEGRLASMASKAGWNYIHPDFRGKNFNPDACMSPKAVADIDDAIQYAIDHGQVDPDNIFVVGTSGGGFATLGTYMKTRHPVKAYLAWVPISDIEAWYYQSKARGNKYAGHILQSTSDGVHFDAEAARARSPLHWDLPEGPKGRLEIFAGIHDGYDGSVPVSQSILFFNRIAAAKGHEGAVVGPDDMITLLSRGPMPEADLGSIGDREVLYLRDTPEIRLTIFEGAHEMLSEYCFERVASFVE